MRGIFAMNKGELERMLQTARLVEAPATAARLEQELAKRQATARPAYA